MEHNSGERLSCKLQINASGSWKDMLYFDPSQRERVTAGMTAILQETGNPVTWRVVHVCDNPGDWLRLEATPENWHPVTDREPAPLEDVMVSVLVSNDEAPVVFMAYRKAIGTKAFYISGTGDHVIQGAYAWKRVDEPAPAPKVMA